MASLESYSKSVIRFLSTKKGVAGIGVVILAALVLLLNRCSNIANEESYFIGQDIRWKGVTLMGKERNFSAFNHDLLATIAQKEEIRFKLLGTAADELEHLLLDGELQGVLTLQQPSPVNQSTFVFSDTIFATGPVLTVSTQSHIEGWNELGKKIVGAASFSPTVLEMQKDHTIQIKLYDNISQAFADLDSQKIDGVIFPAIPSYIYIHTFYKGRLKIVTAPLNDEGVRLMALNEDEGKRLVAEFNRGLHQIKADGTYEKLIERWGLVDASKPLSK